MAWKEAKRLRSTAFGPEEFLLAILHPDAEADTIAARALRDCGIDRDALAELAKPRRSKQEIAGGPQINPAGYQLRSLAEGIAAGLGARAVTSEHVLLAFIWEPTWSSWQLERLGSSREQLKERLAALGVELPQQELPSPDPRKWGPKVDVTIDELWILLRELPYVMPQRAQLCFSHDWKQGSIGATEGVDLRVYIPRAFDRHRRLNLPPDASAA